MRDSNKRRSEHTQLPSKEPDENQNQQENDQECQVISYQQPNQELPFEIVVDIVSRLPIKTVFSCLLVCKRWASLLTAPGFVRLHLQRSPISVLIQPMRATEELENLHSVDIPNANNAQSCDSTIVFRPAINLPNVEFDVLYSCNGLVCLRGYNDTIYIGNPILGEYVALPECPVEGTQCRYAFGFIPQTEQYKVVRVFKRMSTVGPVTGSPAIHEAEVYTLGQDQEGSWRSIGFAPYPLGHNAFLEGKLHWFDSNSLDFFRCFDFESEQFGAVPTPPEFDLMEDEWSMGVLQSCLYVCDFTDLEDVEIWIMKEYGVKESWSKDFVIKNLVYAESNVNNYEPIMILSTGEILLFLNIAVLVRYDPKSGAFVYVPIHGIDKEFLGIAYVPSFVSLKDVAKGDNLLKVYKASVI